MSTKLSRRLLLVAGTVSTATGIVGIFLPILPTTPFLLLAAACYIRSSERLYHWLLRNRILGAYITSYIQGKGMTLRIKLLTLLLLWCTIGISIWIGTQNTIIRIVLAIVAVGVTTHIVSLKTRKREPAATSSEDRPATGEVFDEIAPSWYNLRHHSIFTTELEELAGRWRGGKLLNVGCGHGPDFMPFREGYELYGVDISSKMLELARKYAEKYHFQVELTQADARQLPYGDRYFDCAIAVAAFHHIAGEEARLKALKELKRVLKPGGEAFITVWNKWQPRFWLKKNDITVPWKAQGKTLYRYYHLFSYGELRDLLIRAGFEIAQLYHESSYQFPIKCFSRNVCALVKKAGISS